MSNNNNSLQHAKWKYVKREWKNGRWQYTYDSKTERTDKAYKFHKEQLPKLANYQNQYSRNMPGNSTDDNAGKSFMTNRNRMSISQINAAKKAGAAVKVAQKEKDKQVQRQHALKLKSNERDNSSSRNIPSKNSMPVNSSNKTTKKQIRKGIRRAKVKTLKREAKKYISRAQSWLNGLFD